LSTSLTEVSGQCRSLTATIRIVDNYSTTTPIS